MDTSAEPRRSSEFQDLRERLWSNSTQFFSSTARGGAEAALAGPERAALEQELNEERRRAQEAEHDAAQHRSKYEVARRALGAAMVGWSEAQTRPVLEELETSECANEVLKSSESQLLRQVAEHAQTIAHMQDDHERQMQAVRQELAVAERRICILSQHTEKMLLTHAEGIRHVEGAALALVMPECKAVAAGVGACLTDAATLAAELLQAGVDQTELLQLYNEVFDTLEEARVLEARLRSELQTLKLQLREAERQRLEAETATHEALSEAAASARRCESAEDAAAAAEKGALWFICTCTCTYAYAYAYIHIHVHIHIYIYMYMYK